jgi:multiple antibiotic resistance protein
MRLLSTLPLFDGLVNLGSVVTLAVGALLPIVDPLGGAPIYLAMTAGLTAEQRCRIAKIVAFNSFLLLLASTLIGAYVLDFFGLSIPSTQVAGGIVICMIAWSLLNSSDYLPMLDRRGSRHASSDQLSQRAFYPLTMPLTVGPGSISVALTLGANPPPGLRALLITALGHALGILMIAWSVYLCYRYADRILRTLGAKSTGVVLRLTAFILLCIGVQICWNGAHALILSGFPSLSPGIPPAGHTGAR